MSVLLLLESENGKLKTSARSALQAASSLGEVDILLIGDAKEDAAKLPDVGKVLHIHNEICLAETLAPFIVSIAKNYSHILAVSSSLGKDVIPRAAGILDVEPISDIIKIINDKTFVRPIYAGNILATVESNDKIKLLTIRASSFDKKQGEGDAPVEDVSLGEWEKTSFVKQVLSQSDRPDLETARIIVSGGKGLKSAENFKEILEPLADKLGAAIGASRAAVDSDFAPNDMQVGQTGKIVAPDLYIAIGLSGAIQHVAGMKNSKVIVAINLDPDAPIFKIADYGLVGDLFEIVPELDKLL